MLPWLSLEMVYMCTVGMGIATRNLVLFKPVGILLLCSAGPLVAVFDMSVSVKQISHLVESNSTLLLTDCLTRISSSLKARLIFRRILCYIYLEGSSSTRLDCPRHCVSWTFLLIVKNLEAIWRTTACHRPLTPTEKLHLFHAPPIWGNSMSCGIPVFITYFGSA